MTRPLHRRTLLRGAGGVALGLPFLQAMHPSHAQEAAPPRRLLIVYHGQGMFMDQWKPQLTVPADTPEVLADAYTMNHLTAALEPHKNDLVFLTGITDQLAIDDPLQKNGHEAIPRLILTGALATSAGTTAAGGPSLDYEIGQRIYDIAPKTRAMHVGVRPPAEICYTGANSPIEREINPASLFDFMFSDLSAPDDPAVQARKARRTSVLDATLENATSLRQQLGSADGRLIEQYLERVNDIARGLDRAVSCSVADLDLRPSPSRLPGVDVPGGFHPYYDWEIAGANMNELVAMALACDLTRVVTLSWGQPNEWHFMEDPVSGGPLVSTDWHENVVHRSWHEPGDLSTAQMIDEAKLRLDVATVWMQEQFAALLDRLKSFPEGDGTLLDNTMVLYVNEFGATHQHNDKPYLIAGSCGGLYPTGRWLRYDDVPQNRLLLSVLRAFIDESDPIHSTFGASEYNAGGPLGGLI